MIDVDAIAQAVLDEIAASGVAKTTATAVAARLEVSPRALYHYLASRQDMFRAAAVLWIRNAPTIPDTGDWRADLMSHIESTIAYLSRHPAITDIGMVEGVVVYSEEFFDHQEANLSRLVAAGLDDRRALSILTEIVRFCEGLARYYGATRDEPWAVDQVMAGGVEHLERSDQRYPVSQRAGFIPGAEQQAFAIRMFLDGIAAQFGDVAHSDTSDPASDSNHP